MSKFSVNKVGGLSAILAAVCFMPWIVYPKIAPLIGIEFPKTLDLEPWARLRAEHHAVTATVDWLVIVGLVCEMFAAVAFFYVLRHVGPWTWFGLAAWLAGLQLVMIEHVFVLANDLWFMARYLSAPDSAKPAWEVFIVGLNRTRLVLATVGNHLDLGVGVPIFALASLRAIGVPKWVGWLGLVVGLLTWLQTWLPINLWPSPAFTAFIVWLLAMGTVWLRLKEPKLPSDAAE